jgi:hypothetical protein
MVYIHSPGLNPVAAKRYTNAAKKFVAKKPIPGLPTHTGSTLPVAPPTTDAGFYPFNDYYGNLLAKLASIKSSIDSGLNTGIETRSKNVQGIVDASRNPLNASYSTAIQEAAAVNDAVANRLNSQGGTATEDLRSKLASLGQDPTAATADLSKYYAGTSGANYATDSGDVQRLIGRKAEENALLDKTPAIMRAQMEGDLATNQASVNNEYLQQAFGLAGQSADARSAYDQAKFSFDQAKLQTAQDTETASEKLYWDNYWAKQDNLLKRWQTNIASGDKKAANATKKQIEAAQRQSAKDIATIRANASTTAASTRADATTASAATRAQATKDAAAIRAAATKAASDKAAAAKKGASSNINQQRALQAAINAVIITNPKTKASVISRNINPAGYNADWTMTRAINDVLKSYGINPATAQGRNMLSAVLTRANGLPFAAKNDPLTGDPIPVGRTYHYDPNWADKAKKLAASKKKAPKKPGARAGN